MATYKEFHQYSIEKPNEFWTEQAQLIDWKEPFTQVCDYSRPPFAKWFVGGKTNLCYNAVDRHAAKRPNDRALIYISTETNEEVVYGFAELQAEVERMAAIYKSLGVKKGDRVLIYMPMIAQAACDLCCNPYRCHPLGGVWRFRFGFAGDAYRRCQAGADRFFRRRHARWQGGAVQASA